jgi:DNA-binding NarL/FixJ family response regulator
MRLTRYMDTDTERIARLSDDERAVIRMVARGLSDEGIAQHLSMSDSAVTGHLDSIYGKLNVDARFELLIYSFLKGLADPANP